MYDYLRLTVRLLHTPTKTVTYGKLLHGSYSQQIPTTMRIVIDRKFRK
jgi:hypothetical protein